MKAKFWKKIIWAAAGIAIVIILLPLAMNKETKLLNEESRAELGGEFIRLSEGYVHYASSGSADGQVMVLVHGFSAPMYIWDGMAGHFSHLGYRVLQFDLYGRGFSDRPETDYDLELYVRQLVELLDALEITEPVILAGLSYSGPITARFTSQYPERVQHLILFDPMAAPVTSAELAPMTWPLLGEYFLATFLAPVYLPGSQTDDLKYPERYPDWEARYREQLQYAGFRNAILSSTREMVNFDPLGEYRAAGESGVPIALIWGEEDHLIPEERILSVWDALGGVPFERIPDADHLSFLDQPDAVYKIMVELTDQ